MCKLYESSTGPVPTNSMQAKGTIASLKRLADLITAGVLPEHLSARLEVTFSKGSGSFPRVPWVAIVPAGKTVSGTPSVAICFGRTGNGAVAGLMAPAGLTGGLVTVARSRDSASFVNVDSGKSTAAYNNKFVNPREFAAGTGNWSELRDHLSRSLKLFGYK